MHFVYLDDSKGDGHVCFSAIAFPAASWNEALAHLVGIRRQMNKADGIYMTKELHATEWLGGRGKIAREFVPKGARERLFKFHLTGITMIPGVQIFNGHARSAKEERLFEYMLNRIQTNMSVSGSQALIFSDEGKSYDHMLRRLRKFNHIPSRFGGSRNLPLTRVVEDIIYRDSARSFFVQAADACAFSLLRFKHPTPKAIKYGIDQAFTLLERSCVKQANRSDPFGIVYA